MTFETTTSFRYVYLNYPDIKNEMSKYCINYILPLEMAISIGRLSIY